jgi:hypothetical protein
MRNLRFVFGIRKMPGFLWICELVQEEGERFLENSRLIRIFAQYRPSPPLDWEAIGIIWPQAINNKFVYTEFSLTFK